MKHNWRQTGSRQPVKRQCYEILGPVRYATDNDVTEERINADAYSYNAFRIGSNDGGQENISREHYV